MIAAGQGDRWEQPLRPQLLERRGGEGEVVEPPLHLRTGQGLVAELAHGRADGLCGEHAFQHAQVPIHRADIAFRPRPLAPGIDVGEDVLDEWEVGPRAQKAGADEADRRLPSRHHALFRALHPIPHDLVAGEARPGPLPSGPSGS